MDGVEHIKKFVFFQRHDRASYKPTFVDQLIERLCNSRRAVFAVSLGSYLAEAVMPAHT